MLKLMLSLLLFISTFLLGSEDNFKGKLKEFQEYKKSQEQQFASYQKAQMKAFYEYKKELSLFWDNPQLSTKKRWFMYTEDKKTRSDVDFSNNTIIVETIAKSQNEAKQNLKIALAKAVTMNNKTVQNTDPLEKKLLKIKKQSNIQYDTVDNKPILSTVVFDKKPTKKSVKTYVDEHVKDSYIKVKKHSKQKYSKIYSIEVKLPSDTILKLSKLYQDDIEQNAAIRKLPKSLIFAIIHSESSFNPRARSHIPAYGLMQIVPSSAGRDTYKFLYNEDKLVSGSYLYNSKNNIKMGTAYLHILYYRYLVKIKNLDSRLYCTIAAYNTGAGNIAYAFTETYNMNKAAPLINHLTPNQVYTKLLKDLKYDEPKQYLKRVLKRMAAYRRVYGT